MIITENQENLEDLARNYEFLRAGNNQIDLPKMAKLDHCHLNLSTISNYRTLDDYVQDVRHNLWIVASQLKIHFERKSQTDRKLSEYWYGSKPMLESVANLDGYFERFPLTKYDYFLEINSIGQRQEIGDTLSYFQAFHLDKVEFLGRDTKGSYKKLKRSFFDLSSTLTVFGLLLIYIPSIYYLLNTNQYTVPIVTLLTLATIGSNKSSEHLKKKFEKGVHEPLLYQARIADETKYKIKKYAALF